MRYLRVLIAAIAATGLFFVAGSAVATAAPTKKGTVTVQSGLLGLAGLLGVQVSTEGNATMTDAGIVYPVVGNTEKTGSLKQVGTLVLSKADGSSLSLTNPHMDMTTLEVSMVVNHMDRVVLFQGVQDPTDPNTVTLHFTAEGAQIVGDFFGPGISALLMPGGPFNAFGTATYAPAA